MASLYADPGQGAEAIDLYQQSWAIAERIGDVKPKAATFAMMGQAM
jgi:hypothetical protein